MKNKRGVARKLAVQAVYQWQLTQADPEEVRQQFLNDQDISKADIDYFKDMMHVLDCADELDEHFRPFIDRVVEQLDPVECAILRIACYELANRSDVPYKVVINEAVRLAKVFGADQSHKYINAVLDKVANTLRKSEINKSSH